MASGIEPAIYYSRIYIKILDIKTGNDLTSVSTITVEYNGTTYNTSKSSNGSNVYDINGFPNLTTSVSVICHADCEGYTPSNVQCDTIRNYDASLTPTTLSLYKEYPKTITGQIERINDAKTNVKSALIDKGFTVSDTDKIDSYSKIIDQITSQFNQYNYEYNGVADDDGLKVIGWNDVDIAYFKYNNLHPKSESVGDTYKVSDVNKQIKITSINDISTYKNNANFKYCPKFDTSDVVSMRNIFSYCESLITIPKLNTSNVVDMYGMFDGCSALTTIPLLNTVKVTNMGNMFIDCLSLTDIPLLDTSNVTIMYQMFGACSALTTIPQLNTSNVTNIGRIFLSCSSLTSIPLFDTSNVTDMGGMFINCSSLTSIPLLDTSKVTLMGQMFYDCSSLTTIPQLNTSKVKFMDYMFSGCSSLTSIPLLNTSNVTNMSRIFSDCSSLTTLSGFTGLKVDLSLSDSPNLTHVSLLNVINKATDVTSSPKTLTLGTTNLAKLTDEEKAIATNKGWILQ